MENSQLMELIGSALSTAMESITAKMEQTQGRIDELEKQVEKLKTETQEEVELPDSEIADAVDAIM